MHYSVSDLAQLIKAEIEGDSTRLITGVGGLEDAGPDQVSFLANLKYARSARQTKAGAIVIGLKEPKPQEGITLLRVENPSKAFAALCDLWLPTNKVTFSGIHPSAIIAPSAKLGKGVSVHAGAVIEEGVEIGEGTIIGANVYLGHEVKLGARSCLYANVTIYERCLLGNEVMIHSGVVIGADGFGFDLSQESAEKIPQVGIVQIDDRVEIGANTTIDRARFGRTWIQEGVKIDNLVQIAHNVVIGKNTLIAAQTGISGSTRLGQRVIIAGQVGMVGHIRIEDGAIVTAQSGVSKDIPKGEIVSGCHAMPIREMQRIEAAQRRLPHLLKQIKALEERLQRLEKN